ncbi:MAG TPA: hypothetical protein VE616_12500, partial [Candidatus Udaeobacter sp.]|nr:hypothetical protein [Candidatus Udaeobacter sp.]
MIRSQIRSLCFLSDNRKSKIQNLKWVVVVVAVFTSAVVRAGEARWQTEWEQTLAAAKKEGEISFYGSQGYEKVFEVFQKK